MTTIISNVDDVIDSRDIIERIEELESDRDILDDAVEEAQCAVDEAEQEPLDEGIEGLFDIKVNALYTKLNDAISARDNWGDEQEYEILKKLAEEGKEYASDWKWGETLIRYDNWVAYARDLTIDCGYMPSDIPSFLVIDWEATANNIAADYTTVDFDGVEYYIRAC